MQHIYMHSHEHFEVFTTVLAPQGRYRCRAEAEQMVVVHSYRPHWPDELQLRPGDIIVVLSKHEEERWFGRRQDGQQGYFPASCVMELSQISRPSKQDLHRTLSRRSSAWDGNSGVRRRQTNGHILQGSRVGGGGGATGGAGGGLALDEGRGESKNPFLVHRPQIPLPQPVASPPQSHRSPGLLHRILSKCRKKSECQGATNGAFEGD